MKKILLLIPIIALAAGAWWWWQTSRAPEQTRVIATADITTGTVRQVLQQTGIVKSQVGAIVKIGARATGTIDRMLVKVGDRVEKGQVVAVIDSRELDSRLTEASAQLDLTEAELARIRRVFPLRIAEAKAQLELARAVADYRRATLDRKQELAARKVISRDELEDTAQQAAVEDNRVAAQQATLSREKQEFAQELRKAKASVARAEASVHALETQISYTRIVSPLTGVVSQVAAQEGETIVAGLQVANLITVLDPGRLEMWIYVDETDIGQVRTGQLVEYTVDAYPDAVFEGSIATVYPEPEIRDNIVYYRALVTITPDQAARLRPEMTTQVKIITARKDDVLVLPNSALKWVDGKQVVFVVGEGGTVRESVPALGLTGVDTSEILSGIDKGARVATQIVLPGKKGREGGR
jgi:HlyD family secretion protein/macrolide-specific efflux system membrane fusion protein